MTWKWDTINPENENFRRREFSFPRLIVVPLSCHEVDGVRKEKERLTAAAIMKRKLVESWLQRLFFVTFRILSTSWLTASWLLCNWSSSQEAPARKREKYYILSSFLFLFSTTARDNECRGLEKRKRTKRSNHEPGSRDEKLPGTERKGHNISYNPSLRELVGPGIMTRAQQATKKRFIREEIL